MTTYTLKIKDHQGNVSDYSYQSEKNEIVNVMWQGQYIATAKNGKEVKGHYVSMNRREVESV